MVAIDLGPQLIDLMCLKNANFEKEAKSDWVYILNNDNYSIDFLII